MNKFSSENIIKNLVNANMISISPLEMTIKKKNNILLFIFHNKFILFNNHQNLPI